MPVVIKWANSTATIEDGKWKSDDKNLLALVRVYSRMKDVEIRGSDPYPDYNLAERIVGRLEGTTIVSFDPPTKYEEQVF